MPQRAIDQEFTQLMDAEAFRIDPPRGSLKFNPLNCSDWPQSPATDFRIETELKTNLPFATFDRRRSRS